MAITKEKGDLGQSLIMADLLKRGFKVLLPLGEDWKFDLVLFREGKFERVQCKYDGINTDFCIVRCNSSNSWKVHKYTSEEIDWMACYHKASDTCYYLPSSMLGENGRKAVNLRINPAKNNQKKGILEAKDFLNI
jgi:hypothetical protein